MTYVPPEKVRELRKLDILTYFQNYRPGDLLRYDKNAYVLRCNSAVRIEKGYWDHWNKKDRILSSALDYLIAEEHYSFPDAAGHLLRLLDVLPPVTFTENDEKSEHFRIPWNNGDPSLIELWLTENQGLEKEFVKELLDQEKIYEEKYTHHIVFPAFNKDKEMVSAFRKSIAHSYGETVTGSLAGYAFAWKKENAEETHLFEHPLDLLSYVNEVRKKGEEDPSCLCLLSAEKEESFFLPLLPYLKDAKELKRLVLHLDQDSAGLRAAEKLKKLLGKSYEVKENEEEKEEC